MLTVVAMLLMTTVGAVVVNVLSELVPVFAEASVELTRK